MKLHLPFVTKEKEASLGLDNARNVRSDITSQKLSSQTKKEDSVTAQY